MRRKQHSLEVQICRKVQDTFLQRISYANSQAVIGRGVGGRASGGFVCFVLISTKQKKPIALDLVIKVGMERCIS